MSRSTSIKCNFINYKWVQNLVFIVSNDFNNLPRLISTIAWGYIMGEVDISVAVVPTLFKIKNRESLLLLRSEMKNEIELRLRDRV